MCPSKLSFWFVQNSEFIVEYNNPIYLEFKAFFICMIYVITAANR